MKKLLAILIAVVLALTLAVPAMAASVDTSVNVLTGGSVPPVVKCFWTADGRGPSHDSETGDPTHQVLGVQIKPVPGFQNIRQITFYAVVTDLMGWGNISHVFADVYYPTSGTTDPGKNGELKFEVELTRSGTDDFAAGVFKDAAAAGPDADPIFGMTTINTSAKDPQTEANINEADIVEELEQQMAIKYFGTYYMENCELAGRYKVVINAFNIQGAMGSLEGWFDWVGLTAADFDFNKVNYGSVPQGSQTQYKPIGGDRDWDIPEENPAPSPNGATIANIGNTYLRMTVNQNDMGLGKTVLTGGGFTWNVHYGVRLGDDNPVVYYDPGQTATTAQILKLCALEKIDFYIKIDKDLTAGTPKVGTMTLGAVVDPGPPTHGTYYPFGTLPNPHPDPQTTTSAS